MAHRLRAEGLTGAKVLKVAAASGMASLPMLLEKDTIEVTVPIPYKRKIAVCVEYALGAPLAHITGMAKFSTGWAVHTL